MGILGNVDKTSRPSQHYHHEKVSEKTGAGFAEMAYRERYTMNAVQAR